MRYLRMIQITARLTWPYLLTPWRSPLLRWRMETYGFLDKQGKLLHADEITPQLFFSFLAANRKALAHFLSWAAAL